MAARRAWASIQAITCRYQGPLPDWYWSRPSRSFPLALFFSIFQRIPATAISSGTGVGSGRGEDKLISLVSLTSG